jgi:hypothetical protein
MSKRTGRVGPVIAAAAPQGQLSYGGAGLLGSGLELSCYCKKRPKVWLAGPAWGAWHCLPALGRRACALSYAPAT